MKTLGQRIRTLRIKHDLTQEEIALQLGMKRPNFANYEADRTVPPSDVLSKMADILKTSTDYLLCKTDNPLPQTVEERFLSNTDLPLDELLNKFNFTLDGKQLTREQAIAAITFVRALQAQNIQTEK